MQPEIMNKDNNCSVPDEDDSFNMRLESTIMRKVSEPKSNT